MLYRGRLLHQSNACHPRQVREIKCLLTTFYSSRESRSCVKSCEFVQIVSISWTTSLQYDDSRKRRPLRRQRLWMWMKTPCQAQPRSRKGAKRRQGRRFMFWESGGGGRSGPMLGLVVPRRRQGKSAFRRVRACEAGCSTYETAQGWGVVTLPNCLGTRHQCRQHLMNHEFLVPTFIEALPHASVVSLVPFATPLTYCV